MPICFIPLGAGAKKMVALTSTCKPPVMMSCMLYVALLLLLLFSFAMNACCVLLKNFQCTPLPLPPTPMLFVSIVAAIR